MDENTSLPEYPIEETPQPPAAENMTAETSLAPGDAAQPPAEATPPAPAEPEKLHVDNSMAFSVSAKHDAEVNNSMAFAVAAGNDMTSTQSVDMVTAVGRDLCVHEGAVMVATVGGQVQAENSRIGLLVAKSGVTLNNSPVLMTTQQALALGAALGVVFALVSKLLGRKKCC